MDRNKDIIEGLFQIIGRTPLVKLQKIPKAEGVDPNVLGKVEYFNPTGSLKDRIYYEMITKAIEACGLKPSQIQNNRDHD